MIGIDMVYIPRVQKIMDRCGEAFLEKVFPARSAVPFE